MNMNKVYFYIAALSIVIGGVWLSLPSDEQRAKMAQAAQQRKLKQQAAKQKNEQPAVQPNHASSVAASANP